MSGRQLRGVASMTNTEVEAANRAIAATGSGFVFVPTLDMAAGSKSSRTPHIHFDAQGNDIGEKVPAHSASAPVPKKQKAPRPPGRPAGEPRVRTQAPPPWPGQPQSLTQQRSKRPKLQARASTGGAFRDDEKAGNSAELKACAKLLKEVTRHTFAWPFVKAVDPTAFPDYYQVVTNPIDLGMIERGLKNNQYEDADEFYADVKRVWANCYMYNPPETDVHKMANTLEKIAQDAFDNLDRTVAAEVAKGGENAQVKAMQKQMAEMKKMMAEQKQMLQQQQQMQMGGAMMPMQQQMPAPAGGGGGGRGGRRRSGAPESTAMVAQANMNRDMSYEEKTSLSGAINRLNSANLDRVVKIIQENMPNVGNDDNPEIEIDINSLDRVTLWALKAFVDSCKATKKKPKAPKASAQSTQAQLGRIEQARAAASRSLADAQGGLSSLGGGGAPPDAGPSGGWLGGGGGGIALGGGGDDGGAESPSDSDSDEGAVAAALPSAAGGGWSGGGGGGAWNQWQATKAAADAERAAAERKAAEQQAAAAAAAEQRRQAQEAREKEAQRQREQQRAAERAAHEDNGDGADMMGSMNEMAAFEAGSWNS